MKILAFDPATAMGVAIGDAQDGPLCHTERLGEQGKHHGQRFLQSQIMTARLIKQHKPDLIALEQAIVSGVKGGEQRAQLAFGLRACIMSVAFKANIRVVEYPVQTIRKHFIGNGALKRNEAKSAVMIRCKQLGWHVTNDNEADAAAVWEYARTAERQISTLPPNGLFEHANNTSNRADRRKQSARG
jgi:Holliday junction resolvasome RuvABC endonuclease subunit